MSEPALRAKAIGGTKPDPLVEAIREVGRELRLLRGDLARVQHLKQKPIKEPLSRSDLELLDRLLEAAARDRRAVKEQG